MSKFDREMYIEWLSIWTGYTKDYWIKQSDETLELNYKKFIAEHGY